MNFVVGGVDRRRSRGCFQFLFTPHASYGRGQESAVVCQDVTTWNVKVTPTSRTWNCVVSYVKQQSRTDYNGGHLTSTFLMIFKIKHLMQTVKGHLENQTNNWSFGAFVSNSGAIIVRLVPDFPS